MILDKDVSKIQKASKTILSVKETPFYLEDKRAFLQELETEQALFDKFNVFNQHLDVSLLFPVIF